GVGWQHQRQGRVNQERVEVVHSLEVSGCDPNLLGKLLVAETSKVNNAIVGKEDDFLDVSRAIVVVPVPTDEILDIVSPVGCQSDLANK
ncbi:hypothetical protein A2U01_0075969, partial [Trifolium medium]|nr:hypothetical protein [Trifolium medium]